MFFATMYRFTLCLAFGVSLLNAAEFEWDKDLKYRLEDNQPISFWVGAKDGPIEQVVFQIHRIEDNKGFSLFKPGDAPPQQLAQLDERGHRFEFKPDLKILALAQSYTVHFKLFGQTKPGDHGGDSEAAGEQNHKVVAQGKFQIHRQSHELEVQGLPEAPVRIYRFLPTFPVAHAMTVLLRGPSDPLPPKLDKSQAVYLLDKAGKKSRLIEQKQSTVSLGTQQKSAPLPLSVTSLKGVGRYQVINHLVRDYEKEPTELAYEVIVSDHWWLPLAVIFIGVLVAYTLRYRVQTTQPNLTNQASFADWTHRIEAKMRLFPNEDRLTRLWAQLQNLKLGTGHPNQQAVEQTLSKMATDFDAFLADVGERKKAFRQKFTRLREQFRNWHVSLPQASDHFDQLSEDRLFLNEAQSLLEDVDNRLNQNQIITAQKLFFELEDRTKSKLKGMLRPRLTTMLKQANELEAETESPMLKDLKQGLAQSLDSLNQPDTDLFVVLRSHYQQKASLEECQEQFRVSKAISTPTIWTEIYQGFSLTNEAPKPISAARVLTSGRLHKVHQSIEFELYLTPEIAEETARVRWYFGDGTSVTESGYSEQTAHTFETPCESYTITVDVFDATYQRLFQDTILLTISPSDAQTKARKARRFFEYNELVMSLVALLIAAGTGFWKLYLDEAFFGRPQDYLTAFLWGFGLDSSLQGLKPIVKNFRESLDKT